MPVCPSAGHSEILEIIFSICVLMLVFLIGGVIGHFSFEFLIVSPVRNTSKNKKKGVVLFLFCTIVPRPTPELSLTTVEVGKN